MRKSSIVSFFGAFLLAGCYEFSTDPLAASGALFRDTQLFQVFSERGFPLPEAPRMSQPGAQRSPFGDLSAESSVVEISASEVLFSFQQGGDWFFNLVALSESHVFVCTPLADRDNPLSVAPGASLDVSVVNQPMDLKIEVSGPEEAVYEFAVEIYRNRPMACVSGFLPN